MKPSDASVDAACQNGKPGCKTGIEARVEFNLCPHVAFSLAPNTIELEREVEAHAVLEDLDQTEMELRWSAEPDGTFDDANAAQTLYRCESAGVKIIAITVTDEDGCASKAESWVTCLAAGSASNPDTDAEVDAQANADAG